MIIFVNKISQFNYWLLFPKNCNKIITQMKKHKQKIKEKGLKISWLAEQLKISQPTLSMYLNDKRQIPYDVEIRLNNLLK